MKHGKPPAFQFYPADFLVDENVVTMSLEERGAYITLLCHCWLETTIPADLKALARLCGVTHNRMKKLWPSLDFCFFLEKNTDISHATESSRLKNLRLEQERLKQKNYKSQQSENGKKGAQGRWHKGDTSTDGEDEPMGSPLPGNGVDDGVAMVSPMAKNGSSSSSSSSTPTSQPAAQSSTSPRSPDGDHPTCTAADIATAKWMHQLNIELQPGGKRKAPNFAAWGRDIRLMRERDGRTDSDIRELYQWCHDDEFWRANILCPSKLREKWDNLQLKRTNADGRNQPETRARAYDPDRPIGPL